MAASLDIVIVNWNAGLQLRDCLDSIDAADHKGITLQRVVVVDNGSHDNSLSVIAQRATPPAVIRNTSNQGFAVACNQGARGSKADYLLFLNPDARLLARSLVVPLEFMERPQHHEMGVVGIQLIDSRGQVAPTCARFPTASRFITTMLGLDRVWPKLFPPHFMVEWDHSADREVDQIMGAFFLVRRSLFETLRGFDERFFVYFEEVDFSLRARDRGFRSFYLSTAKAYHRGGGVTEQAKGARLFYSLRSRMLYSYKHFGAWSASLVTLATLFVEPISRCLLAVARRSESEFVATVEGYALLWKSLAGRIGARLRGSKS